MSSSKTSSLEELYRTHHASRRGVGFALLKDERGQLLRRVIGTGKRVLDIGCRDGALTGTYAAENIVLGLDIDSVALQQAATKYGIKTQQADLHAPWPVDPGAFDVVVAAEVLEHLYFPEQAIAQAAHALCPNGCLVGTVPNAFSLINRFRYLQAQKRHTPLADPTHINHFTAAELRSLLAAQFENVSIVGMGRLGSLARGAPQLFAFDLGFIASQPRRRDPNRHA